MAIFKRFPSVAQIAALSGVLVFVLSSWTLLWFFWKYPSWLYFLQIGEILTVLAYALATNFFESLVVLAALLALAVILPKKWFAETFAAHGLALALPVLGYMIFIAYQFQAKADYPSAALNWAPVVLAGAVLLAFLVGRIPFLRRAVELFADRATIFLYFFLPISLLSVLVVVFRMFQ